MDLAYDHITEQSLPDDQEDKSTAGRAAPTSTINADFQAAYSAFSSSPWASRLGGFLGNVVKQGESVYKEASQEVTSLGQDASKGLSDLRASLASRTRGMSLSTQTPGESSATTATTDGTGRSSTDTKGRDGTTPTADSADVLARIKDQAAKRLKDLQQAEDAADEALVKFGTGVRNFLRDAISIAPPTEGTASNSTGAVLFESKDASGKRVIHTSRFDAQLHVIHSNTDSFAKDPTAATEFASWSETFDIGKKTDDIAADLNKYPELRSTMEKLVPDTIPYADFWKRYYFLRHGIETAEARRRDLLKAASAEEEIGWDEDSDDDNDDDKTKATPKLATKPPQRPGSTESSTTIHPPPAKTTTDATTTAAAEATEKAEKTVAPSASSSAGLLKPTTSPRKSNDEKSQADSEASYDMVGAKSGAPSQAPNSPRELAKADDDSEEEDWE